jgi:hypothetical protein
VELGRTFTVDEARRIDSVMTKRFGGGNYAIPGHRSGFQVLNFSDLTDKSFRDTLKSVINEVFPGDTSVRVSYTVNPGELVNKTPFDYGPDYGAVIARGSRTLSGGREVLQSVLENYERTVAEAGKRYGWTDGRTSRVTIDDLLGNPQKSELKLSAREESFYESETPSEKIFRREDEETWKARGMEVIPGGKLRGMNNTSISPTDLTTSIQKAKASGQSFDEWVKGQGGQTRLEKNALQYKNSKDFISGEGNKDMPENILYRGQYEEEMPKNAFFTDWYEHARQYTDIDNGDGVIKAIEYSPDDVLDIDQKIFTELRRMYGSIDEKTLSKIYKEGLETHGFRNVFESNKLPYTPLAMAKLAKKVLSQTVNFTDVTKTPSKMDLVVPIMQDYANKNGKFIIRFEGSDYGMYGGATEYVVSDTSKFSDLEKIWQKAHKTRSQLKAEWDKIK